MSDAAIVECEAELGESDASGDDAHRVERSEGVAAADGHLAVEAALVAPQDTAISDDHEIGAVGYFSATGNMSLGMPAEDSRSEESEGGLIGRILDAAVGDNGAPRFDTFASFEEGFERLLEVFFGAHQMLPVQRVMFDGAATTCRSGAKDTGLHVVGPYGCAAGLR